MDCRTIAQEVQRGAPVDEAVQTALQRAHNDKSGAVIRIANDYAEQQCARVSQRLSKGEQLPLAGVPVLIKDNICHQGHITSAGSKMLDHFISPYNADVVERLEQAGAVIIGTTNMDEFAMGSSNETSFFGPVRNPVKSDRVPGGSSGGSAAAVGSHISPLALGSDTGGSIRQPASFCGCVGLKPSYGRVSRYGLIAFGSSLDQIGPLTQNVADAALSLEVLAAYDQRDSTSVNATTDPYSQLDPSADLSGKRVAYIPEHIEHVAPAVAQQLQAALDAMQARGAELVEVHMPHEQHAVATYYIIATGEASSNLSRFDGIHYGHRSDEAKSLNEVYIKSRSEGFGAEVKRRIMLGTYVLSAGYFDAYYKKAQKIRRLICNDYDQAFQLCDVIIGPTSPHTAFKPGDKNTDPIAMYLSDIFTISANLSGIPAISIPYGQDENGLPIGLQLQTPLFTEHQLLQFASVLEHSIT